MLKRVSCVAWNHLEKRELNVGTIRAWRFVEILSLSFTLFGIL